MIPTITSQDPWQPGYTYQLSEVAGTSFDPDFTPDLTPQEMLELGVFTGRYIADFDEFPKEWHEKARLAGRGEKSSPKYNFFAVEAGQSYEVWKAKGWIYEEDPRGWFQWYCRYYLGRRIPQEDSRQIKRWKMMKRHLAQIQKACRVGDLQCRPRQRQALLQWGYDTRKV